jgi:hypothetical protein
MGTAAPSASSEQALGCPPRSFLEPRNDMLTTDVAREV